MSFLGGEETRILFVDNLNVQTTAAYSNLIREQIGALTWCLPHATTDMMQPVDLGVGSALKREIQSRFRSFQEELAEGGGGAGMDGVSAKSLRILITQWVGEAVEAVQKSVDVKSLFQRAGLDLQLDGSDAGQILPQGLKEYTLDFPKLQAQWKQACEKSPDLSEGWKPWLGLPTGDEES